MSRAWRVAVLCASALALGACSDAPLAPNAPADVDAQPIPPWEVHETCADVDVGDRIDFRFESSEVVDFELYYRQGAAVVIPLAHPRTLADSGVFAVAIPGRYCLAFKAGAAGAMVSYHLTVHR
jgi:hypothetical protein